MYLIVADISGFNYFLKADEKSKFPKINFTLRGLRDHATTFSKEQAVQYMELARRKAAWPLEIISFSSPSK